MTSLAAFTILLFAAVNQASCGIDVNAQPTDPVWPNVFQQSFNEQLTYPVLGTHYTTGTYYYDFTNKRYRIDRANGRYDRYCGINGIRAFQNTPCTQLVIDGTRWMIYPDKNDCCECCHAANGCGVLKPTWLTGAQFIREDNGTYVWNQKGLQDNFYVERISDRVMLQINQVPNDIQNFDPATFSKTIPNMDDVFKLPSYCKKGKKCSLLSTCRAVGK